MRKKCGYSLAINRSTPVDDVRLSRPRLHRSQHLLRLEIDRAARRLPCLGPLYAFIVYKRHCLVSIYAVGRLEMSGFAPAGKSFKAVGQQKSHERGVSARARAQHRRSLPRSQIIIAINF